MTLKQEQARRFDRTLQALLAFTNVNLASCVYFKPPIKTDEDILRGFRISLDLWESPLFVDEFLKCPTFRSFDVDFDAIKTWRHALRGPFYVERASGDTAEFLYGDTLFEVRSLRRTWDSMIPYQPDIVYTTLIPYEGMVVHDGFLLHHHSRVRGKGVKRIRRDLARARKKDVVSSAEEFMRVADTLNRERKQGLLGPSEAMVWMDYIAQINELCANSCFPYDIPLDEIPRELRRETA